MAEPDFSYSQQNQDGNGSRPPPLTDEEREQLKQELQKTEGEIATLRIVLQTRIKEANDLKRRLGLSPWQEFADDVNQGLTKMKQSDAYHRTNEILATAGGKVSQTFGQIRGLSVFKSMEDKLGSAYGNVKSKISSSASTDFASTRSKPDMPTASAPMTPMTEKPPPK